METVQSFKGYGKVDEVEEQTFRKKTRKRLIILTISLLVLIILVIGVVVGTLVHKDKRQSDDVSTAPATTIKSICTVTQYPDSCFSSLLSSNTSDPKKIFEFSLRLVFDSLNKISTFPNDYKNRTTNLSVIEALNVCDIVLDDALSTINDSISSLHLDDLKTWLSTVVTDQETCLEALEEVNATFIDEVRVLMRNSTEFSSNSLAIATKFLGMLEDFKIPIHRKLMSESESESVWRLLQESMPNPNVTVAKDGSGNVSTINEAVDLIPLKSNMRFIIYVKAGEYLENVILDKAHWNVMIYGDGKTTTFVSGNKNFIDGTPTFSTATFAVAGRGFIARDISFINTAGAIKHQAVALRSGSDQSVFYRCSFNSFQDTLYAHSNRQFYRDCTITGTIDFIFGNSAVVFQNCNILPRQPLSNQFVTITAQGKKDPNQNTGISIQRCTMTPLDNLTAPTYLGRPWKDYSTTVIMQTSIGGFLNPKGWISWIPNVDPPKSIIYAEYQNTGPGASTSGRVAWAGYKATLTAVEASNYNVQSFIQGPSWLPATSVEFDTT